MLSQINISNFALIENLTIDFYEGLNVLSGETGAGKSILIDAINYVLGSKFNKDLIRYGEDKTYVEAIFTIDNQEIRNELDPEFLEEDFLIISRETFLNGKSLAKINGRSVTVNYLKKISPFLIDIHGQHDNQKLLDKKTHIIYLDSYGDEAHQENLQKYNSIFNEWNQAVKDKQDLISRYGDKDKRQENLKFKIEEISSLDMKIGEDEELSDKIDLLQNAEKISDNLSLCYKLLYESDEDSKSVYESLNICINSLKAVENNLKSLKDHIAVMEDFYYKLQDITYDIRNYMENISYDEDQLNSINSRLYQIQNLKKKYGSTIEDILKYRDELLKEYDEIENFGVYIKKLDNKIADLENDLNKYGSIIHNERVNLGQNLEKRLVEELKYIGMEKSKIKVYIEETDTFYKNGRDQVELLISTNQGEPLKELNRIVSGGELSRVMLSIKTVFADKDNTPSLIFDEIDNGISGKTAQCVGEKLYQISKEHQVFCITHLPQIAVFSDNHYKIEKFSKENKTFTKIEKLNKNSKEMEIARMIGGKDLTKLTIENAKEMISFADNYKL
ncbi:MAG: DNA repair protein RecN [Bacillota bacterium]|nr:DNA repair protein RecN [Bacillota bacterium]